MMESVVAQASSVNGVTGMQANVVSGQPYKEGAVPKEGDYSFSVKSGDGWSHHKFGESKEEQYWVYHAPGDKRPGYKYVWDPTYVSYTPTPDGRYIRVTDTGSWVSGEDLSDPYWAPNGQVGAYSGAPGYEDPWIPPNADPPRSYYPPVVVPPVRSEVNSSVFNRYVQDLDQDGIPDVLERRRFRRGRRRHFFFS